MTKLRPSAKRKPLHIPIRHETHNPSIQADIRRGRRLLGAVNNIGQIDGTDKNVWTGTNPLGVAHDTNPLGATNVRRHWTGWTDWGPAFATEGSGDLREMVAISQELAVIPEPSTAVLLGLGSLALLRRRR